jgi:hypothetical protein
MIPLLFIVCGFQFNHFRYICVKLPCAAEAKLRRLVGDEDVVISYR